MLIGEPHQSALRESAACEAPTDNHNNEKKSKIKEALLERSSTKKKIRILIYDEGVERNRSEKSNKKARSKTPRIPSIKSIWVLSCKCAPQNDDDVEDPQGRMESHTDGYRPTLTHPPEPHPERYEAAGRACV